MPLDRKMDLFKGPHKGLHTMEAVGIVQGLVVQDIHDIAEQHHHFLIDLRQQFLCL